MSLLMHIHNKIFNFLCHIRLNPSACNVKMYPKKRCHPIIIYQYKNANSNFKQNFLIYIKLLHIANPDFFAPHLVNFFYFSENFYQFLHDARIYITFRHYADKKSPKVITIPPRNKTFSGSPPDALCLFHLSFSKITAKSE